MILSEKKDGNECVTMRGRDLLIFQALTAMLAFRDRQRGKGLCPGGPVYNLGIASHRGWGHLPLAMVLNQSLVSLGKIGSAWKLTSPYSQ